MTLGVLQGLTEFLPVSSSGHLVLGGVVLGLKEPHLMFDVVVHCGTLLATLVFYRQNIQAMGAQTLAAARELPSRGLAGALSSRPDAKLFALICLGTIPTGLIGVLFKDFLEGLFGAPKVAAGMLLVTAGLLLVPRLLVKRAGVDAQGMQVWQALAVGLVQGMAIVPGISRSGSTIACGLLVGLNRELAARFSFLLSIPAILGALTLKLMEGDLHEVELTPLAFGLVSSALVGVLALATLIPLVRQGRLHVFAAYLVPVGLLGLVIL